LPKQVVGILFNAFRFGLIVVLGKGVFGATAQMADEAWTQSQQSVHSKVRVMAIFEE